MINTQEEIAEIEHLASNKYDSMSDNTIKRNNVSNDSMMTH